MTLLDRIVERLGEYRELLEDDPLIQDRFLDIAIDIIKEEFSKPPSEDEIELLESRIELDGMGARGAGIRTSSLVYAIKAFLGTAI